MDIPSSYCCAISPFDSFTPICPVCEEDDDGWEVLGDAHVQAASGEAPINGNPDVVDSDGDDVVQPATPLPAPRTPTRREVEVHNLTHLPYRNWCPHCVAARRANAQHRRSSGPSQRAIPLIVADYCFIRDNEDQDNATVLVAKIIPSNVIMATVCDTKGPDENVVARLAQFLKETGHTHMTYKSDQPQSSI